MIVPSILLAFGLAFMFAPRVFASPSQASRLRRLKEIEAGASEAYFEELRDLKTYKPTPRFLWLWRVWGAAIAVGAVGALVIRSGLAG